MPRKQDQRSGDHSINVQAEQINIEQGLSVRDVKEIALDVFRANFLELSGSAGKTADRRAVEITERFLSELQQRNPKGLSTANDPDMQFAIFTAQLEFARSGNEDLADILVDLLVDRTKHPERDILQIVLNESLKVAPKLTLDQIAAVTVIFQLKYTKRLTVRDLSSLAEYLHNNIAPFVPLLTTNNSCYQHLEYAGCGTVGLGSLSLEKIFQKTYAGVITLGFSREQVTEASTELDPDSPLFIPCLRDSEKLQVNALDEDIVREKGESEGRTPAAINALVGLHQGHLLGGDELNNALISAEPSMERLIEVWENSSMKNMTLTSVGMAIGHANMRRVTGDEEHLSIWIN